MRVLVTGSAGFIGRHLIDALAKMGHHVAALDLTELDQPRDSICRFRCDLLDARRLAVVFDEFRPEAVIHLAARTDLDEKKDLAGYAVNIEGVRNLLDAIKSAPTVQRCIYTSSQLVCRVGYTPIGDRDYCPNTLYGESKVLTEKLVRESDGANKEWVLVRPTTVWGPGMSPHYQRFLSMIERGRYFHVGRSRLFKSYGYIGNVVYQYIKLLEAPAADVRRRTLYLADYDPTDLVEWANAFQRALAAPKIPVVPEALAWCAAWAGDLIHKAGAKSFPFTSFRLRNVLTQYIFDLSATQSIVGQLPYSMSEGVRHTAEWFKNRQ